jgi:hypothetical protein
MLFAFVLEREPVSWEEVPSDLVSFVQNAGALAALGLAIWITAYLIQRPTSVSRQRSTLSVLFVGFVCLSAVAYVLFAALLLIQGTEPATSDQTVPGLTVPGQTVPGASPPTAYTYAQSLLLTLGGACAVLAVVVPVVYGLTRLRWRRIWALSRLSLKEALRRRVVWVFAILGLVFLFGSWFVSYKPEHQLRNYVRLVYFALTLLFLIMAGLLGAFSIPADVKNQTIHTIVTKPVERFEIVLGRFLGYGTLLTILLFILSAASLVYVIRGITPEAAAESYKARVALLCDKLEYPGTEDRAKGTNVGREWTYRGYVSGRDLKKPGKEYGVYTFNALPGSLADRDEDVLCEFSFDIFRTNKGQEGKGIQCTFTCVAAHYSIDGTEREYTPEEVERVREISQRLQNPKDKGGEGLNLEQVTRRMIDQYAFFADPGVDVTDFHTQSIRVPASFFRKVVSEYSGQGPAMRVYISVNDISRGQMVGMAKRDLYLLTGEGSFEMNFFKGTVGLWCVMCLVLGLAVACSTYLSGIISFLCAMFLVLTGFFVDDIKVLAAGRSPGGGPSEAMTRLLTRKTMAAQLEESPTKSVVQSVDAGFYSVLNVVLLIIPNVNRYDLYPYVAYGFDISWTEVLFKDNLLPLLAYLLPWAVLAFYLMQFREVANPT